MKYNILASFEYNGKTYVYYMESDNKSVKYGYLDNNNIIEITDTKDIQMMNELSSKVFISSDIKNHIKLGTTTYHGKLFQEMYDKNSDLKFFYEIKDGKYYIPSNEDAMNLFKMFNIHEMFLTNKQYDRVFADTEEVRKKKRNKNILKAVLLSGVAIFVSIEFASCLARTEAIYDPVNDSYLISVFREDEDEDYSEEKLLKSLESNPKLTDDEKQIYKNQLKFVMKYKEYTNFQELRYKFKYTDIIYIDGGLEGDKGTLGDYDHHTHLIRDFYSKDFYSAPLYVTGHEVGHCCSSVLCNHPGINEATTEIVNSEFEYASDVNSYYTIVAFQKIMYEIIGADPFAQYQQSGNILYIINPLMKLINDEELAYNLVLALDNVLVYGDIAYDCNNKYTEEEMQEAKANHSQNNQMIVNILSTYFSIAKGYPMEEDIISMILLNSVGVIQKNIFVNVSDMGTTYLTPGTYSFKKGCFLDEYKNKYRDYTLIFCDMKLKINDSNRRVVESEDGYHLNFSYSEVFLCSDHPGIFKATTEIQNSESESYSGSNDYNDIAAFQKVMYEIIGTNPFEQYQQSGDVSYIIKPLMKLVDDENLAIQLVSALDKVITYGDIVHDYNNKYTEQEKKDATAYYKDNNRTIIGILSKYFSLAKGYPMNEDSVSVILLTSGGIIQKDMFIYMPDGKGYILPPGTYLFKKGYYSDECKNEYKDYTIIFNADSCIKLRINDSNRRVNNSGDNYFLDFDESEVERGPLDNIK